MQKDVVLTEAKKGDVLLIHGTGAYTMSMYSKFHTMLPSPVYGYRRTSQGSYQITCLKERETPQEALAFWGNKIPRPV